MPVIEAVPYPFPYDGKMSKENTALVIIDMQNDCMLTNSLD